MKTKNVIVGVTASVACYKALDVISGLRKLGVQVTVVMTREAEEFIKPVLFQAVSGNKVITHDMFKLPDEWAISRSLNRRIALRLSLPQLIL